MPKFRYLALIAAFAVTSGYAADVEPPPAPLPPAGPLVILTAHALDGHGGTLENVRIGVADGKITSLSAPSGAAVIDLRPYTVMPGWIDTHVHLDSHWNRAGRIATETEPPMETSIGIAAAAWDTLMGGFTTVQCPSAGSSARRRRRLMNCARWCGSGRSRVPISSRSSRLPVNASARRRP
jgi:hypothetical protein